MFKIILSVTMFTSLASFAGGGAGTMKNGGSATGNKSITGTVGTMKSSNGFGTMGGHEV